MSDWYDRANCLGCDPNLFFPAPQGGNVEVEQAKKVCAGCTVADECLEANLMEHHGVYGGTSEPDRRRIRRERRLAAAS